MNLESKSGRRVRRLCGGLSLAALAMLASCGGGTLENAFSPSRIVSFGDEASAMVSASGTEREKYTVNYTDSTQSPAVPRCDLYPIWTQYLANAFNLPFPECVAAGANAPSVMRAVLGAKVADLTTQIDTHLSSGGFSRSDLVTIMVGANDIVEQYGIYVAGGQDLATAESVMQQRALGVAAQVQRVVAAGGKVLIATVPNQGLTPVGALTAQSAADLTTLSSAFNNALRTALVNNSGRDVGLVLADEIVRLDATYPGSYGLNNVNVPLCTTPGTASLLSCTTLTLSSAVDPSTWLWAGNTMLGPTAQGQIGAQAYSRATNNPF